MNNRIIAIANQKGGVGKTSVTVNLGIGLARAGKKVLLIDADPQGSLTESLGYQDPDKLIYTLANDMMQVMQEDEDGAYLKLKTMNRSIIHHDEGIDFVPSNIQLAGLEQPLLAAICREHVLSKVLSHLRLDYDYTLIDCMPRLGMYVINALTAADSVIIPLQPHFLPLKGLEQLLKSIKRINIHLNRSLHITGILPTMVDKRTTFQSDVLDLLHDEYGEQIPIFENYIPHSIRAAEASARGVSIFNHDPRGKVAAAYEKLTEEVISHE